MSWGYVHAITIDEHFRKQNVNDACNDADMSAVYCMFSLYLFHKNKNNHFASFTMIIDCLTCENWHRQLDQSHFHLFDGSHHIHSNKYSYFQEQQPKWELMDLTFAHNVFYSPQQQQHPKYILWFDWNITYVETKEKKKNHNQICI